MSEFIEIPWNVARCPYCDSKLIAMPSAWTEYDGEMLVTEIEMQCTTEPELLSDGDVQTYREYVASHSVMPYVYWLPVYQKVLQWIKSSQPKAGAT